MPVTRIAPVATSGSRGAAIVDHSNGPVARCAPSCSNTMAASIAPAPDPPCSIGQQQSEDAHVGQRAPGDGVCCCRFPITDVREGKCC